MTERPSPRMTSRRPYLLRALYAWILDNGMTPYLIVDARHRDVHVPPSAIKDGQVVLNIGPTAVGAFEMDNDRISFSARFGGVAYPVWIPVPAIMAIYSRETSEGMMLPEDPYDASATPEAASADAEASQGSEPVATDDERESVAGEGADGGDSGDGSGSSSTPKRGGHLRVVK